MKTLSSRPASAVTRRELTRDDVVAALTRAKEHLLMMTVEEAVACCAGLLLALDAHDFTVDWMPNATSFGFEIYMQIILNDGDPVVVVSLK